MKPKHPLISIIIPTYQSAATLTKTLDSITSQSFENYEVCIIDGGSTDGTTDIAASFASRFDQVRFQSESDNGIYDAMNQGVRVSHGEWIYFLGSDDWLLDPQTLARVAEWLKSDCDIVYGNVQSPRLGNCYDGPFDDQKILKKNICHQAIFHNRSVFERFGQFNLKYTMAADWEFNLRWFLSPAIRKVYIDQVIAHYADGGLSSTRVDYAFGDDQMLLYLDYGRSVLNIREKLQIGVREGRRAVQERDLRRMAATFFTFVRACLVPRRRFR